MNDYDMAAAERAVELPPEPCDCIHHLDGGPTDPPTHEWIDGSIDRTGVWRGWCCECNLLDHPDDWWLLANALVHVLSGWPSGWCPACEYQWEVNPPLCGLCGTPTDVRVRSITDGTLGPWEARCQACVDAYGDDDAVMWKAHRGWMS